MTVVNLRIKKRNIDDKAIDASKLEFLNQDEFKAQKADGSSTSLFKLNSSDKFELLKLPIVGSNPTAANELSRKDYVDTGDSAVRGEFAAADALVLADAKDYTDEKVGLEESARMSEDALIRAEFAAADAQIRLDYASADAAVLSESKSYTDSSVATERTARMAQDAAIRSEFAAADQVILQSAKDYTDAEILENVTQKLGMAGGIASLDMTGKVPVAQLPNAIMEYQGMWNASTNSPMLSNSGNPATALGNVYKVSVAGSVDFGAGSISFEVGDYVILGAMGWEKSDTTDAVSSVNGQVGIVVLDTDDVSEGSSNLYFTNMRAQSATIVDTYAGNETDKALSVRASKELAASYQINVDAELESRAEQEKFLITSTHITNQYIDLGFKAITKTLVASIDRLLLIEGDDYTLSTVSGKTRISFTGSIATGGFEALAAGDRFVVRYTKDLR